MTRDSFIGSSVLALCIMGGLFGLCTLVYVALQAVQPLSPEAKEFVRILALFIAAALAVTVFAVASNPGRSS